MWTQPVARRLEKSPAPALGGDGLGDQLKTYFEGLTGGPAPDHLVQLAEALEAAYQRGDLQRCPLGRKK